MVLRGFQRDNRGSIADGEDARLFAVETLFDHHPFAGVAKLTRPHDPFDRFQGLGFVGTDRHPLALGQTIGLHDERR